MQVEIWSDIVCPWCYIGKRRFEAALAAFPERQDVDVRYRSFELDPSRSADTGQTLDQMLASKYGVSLEQAAAMNERVTSVAAGDGLAYRLDRARPGNTFDAHRLTHLAAEMGIQDAVVERLRAGYFTEGAAIGDHEVLARLATHAGLDAASVRETLSSSRFADEVRADESTARQLGITGVPFFVIDRRVGVSGAQSAEVLLGALGQAREETLAVS
jgi:predicted DsbA family dithiol-disulfide isomerase